MISRSLYNCTLPQEWHEQYSLAPQPFVAGTQLLGRAGGRPDIAARVRRSGAGLVVYYSKRSCIRSRKAARARLTISTRVGTSYVSTHEKSVKMRALVQLAVFALALSLVRCEYDFSRYFFQAILNTQENGGLYELYWTFDNEAETISFAVRVNATGWVGFGLSPNGQMPDSDVVIGWVPNGGDLVFHVRS